MGNHGARHDATDVAHVEPRHLERGRVGSFVRVTEDALEVGLGDLRSENKNAPAVFARSVTAKPALRNRRNRLQRLS